MNKVSHAYLFGGESGSGKKMMASLFAMTLQCEKHGVEPCMECPSCKKAQSQNHPDIIYVKHEKPNTISIDEIREQLINDVMIKPYSSPYKIYIIDEAQKLTLQAQNALLKTIEEPEGPVTFILVTSARSALLDTILSRCMPMAFGMLTPQEMKPVLLDRGVPEQEAAELAALSDGSPGRALMLHEHEGLHLRGEVLEFLTQLPSFDMERVWSLASDMGARDREALREWFLYLNMMLRDLLVLAEDGGSALLYHADIRAKLLELLPRYPEDIVFALLGELREVQKRLQANVNLRLLMEGFLIRARDIALRTL